MEGIFFIWTGTKEQVANYFNILNKKHNPIKFEHKMSQTSTTFFDKETFYKNLSEKHFLHVDSEHPKFLKDSIPHSQALRIKRGSVLHQITSINNVRSSEKMDRKELLKERDSITLKKNHLVLTYNHLY